TPTGTNLINALSTSNNPITHLSPPPPPYGTNLAALAGSNPNGTWALFIQDDAPADSGIISNGWILTLTTANIVGQASDNQLLMSSADTTVALGSDITYVITVTNYGPSISTNVLVTDN